jgi:hypothetical protein
MAEKTQLNEKLTTSENKSSFSISDICPQPAAWTVAGFEAGRGKSCDGRYEYQAPSQNLGSRGRAIRLNRMGGQTGGAASACICSIREF